MTALYVEAATLTECAAYMDELWQALRSLQEGKGRRGRQNKPEG
jgi:hypothetical protein